MQLDKTWQTIRVCLHAVAHHLRYQLLQLILQIQVQTLPLVWCQLTFLHYQSTQLDQLPHLVLLLSMLVQEHTKHATQSQKTLPLAVSQLTHQMLNLDKSFLSLAKLKKMFSSKTVPAFAGRFLFALYQGSTLIFFKERGKKVISNFCHKKLLNTSYIYIIS